MGLSLIVAGVWQQTEIASPFYRLDNSILLFARGSRTPCRVDLAGRRQEAGQYIQAFVVDILELQLCDEFLATATLSTDGELLLEKPVENGL